MKNYSSIDISEESHECGLTKDLLVHYRDNDGPVRTTGAVVVKECRCTLDVVSDDTRSAIEQLVLTCVFRGSHVASHDLELFIEEPLAHILAGEDPSIPLILTADQVYCLREQMDRVLFRSIGNE